ncbi:MAG TPA: galactose oxidase-like domain-containing protein [Gaiellaceae bacterium]
MAVRDVYLKIEQIAGYSPVEPETKVTPPKAYKRDCMRNVGHEDATIPQSEVDARRLNALVYREYLDAAYLIPKPDKIVLADINEPGFSRRVPGTVIYAFPGDRLRIHVLNADIMPHSFHVHGLVYGIDSDGSWPFGTQASDGRRSDEICPGQTWTYTFDVTNESLGAWPFHDHSSRMISESVDRGLFGGIVVQPRQRRPPFPPLELPPFVKKFLDEPPRPLPSPLPPAPFPHVPSPPPPRPGPVPPGPVIEAVPMAMAMRMPALRPMQPPGSTEPPDPFPDPRPPLGHPQLELIREYLEDWVHRHELFPIPRPPSVLHVPLFFHFMSGSGATPAFNSGPLAPGAPAFEVKFGAAGTFGYHCSFHPVMQGTVTVAPGNPTDATVSIQDAPVMGFNPASVAVAPGGTVHWTPGTPPTQVQTHTVTENGGGLPSYCFNGRSFVGNTPTILAEAGQRIRWYVFNLDLGMAWHNFHTHGQRWQFGGETIDTRSLGPAESFVAETIAPPAVLLPEAIQATQDPAKRPAGAQAYRLRGDFLVHCHVEMHMQQGLVALLRSHQTVWLTAAQRKQLEDEIGLPLDPGDNACPAVVPDRCETAACGRWEEVAGAPEVTMMHSALVPETTKVLFWGYGRADQSRMYDYGAAPGYSPPANQPVDVAPVAGDFNSSNLHSAAHAFAADGRLLAHGGETQGDQQAFLFTPGTVTWSRTAATASGRFYASTLTLADGKLLTLYGNDASIEVYDPGPGTWSAPKSFPAGFDYAFYPWTYLLPGGELFIAGHQDTTRRFDWTPDPIVQDPAKVWTTVFGDRSPGGAEKGTSVLLPLRPPSYAPRVLNAAGSTASTQQSSEWIDLSAATPAWTALGNLNVPRPDQCTSVLLPDGRVFIAGGVSGSPGPAEIFDSDNPAAGWLLCGDMKYERGYHSSAILLADGSVFVGGDPQGGAGPTPHERFFPAYFYTTRPTITGAPPAVVYGAGFTINTPDAPTIAEVVLLRPGAVTHGWNQSQRVVGCAITGGGAATVQATAPPDGNVAQPGPYLLFIVTSGRIPSEGRWITVGP